MRKLKWTHIPAVVNPFHLHHRKKRRGKFIIQSRIRPDSQMYRFFGSSGWSICGRYETEKARDMALANLQSKDKDIFEYRSIE